MLPSLYSCGRFLATVKRGSWQAAVAGLGVAVLLAAGGCAGGTVAGTVEARIQNRSLSCGFAAQGNGSNLLSAAEAKAAAIKVQFA
jgi:hypothetical protein